MKTVLHFAAGCVIFHLLYAVAVGLTVLAAALIAKAGSLVAIIVSILISFICLAAALLIASHEIASRRKDVFHVD